VTNEQWAHVRRVTNRQATLMEQKYVNGQKEHGGNCWEKPGMLAHALDEVADLPVYLWTLKEQMRALAADLRGGRIGVVAAAVEIERWLQKDGAIKPTEVQPVAVGALGYVIPDAEKIGA
jgi:hypothetical protein